MSDRERWVEVGERAARQMNDEFWKAFVAGAEPPLAVPPAPTTPPEAE